MHRLRLALVTILLLLAHAAQAGTVVENVRIWAENDKTRVVLDLPDGWEVELPEIGAELGAFSVISGSWSEEQMRQKSKELLTWIATSGLKVISAPRAAGYDPPWTIPFLRRSEVLIDVE